MPLIATNGSAPAKPNGHANGKAASWNPKPMAGAGGMPRAEPKRRQRMGLEALGAQLEELIARG